MQQHEGGNFSSKLISIDKKAGSFLYCLFSKEQNVCLSNKELCIDLRTLCDGTGKQHTQCGKFCEGPREIFPYFNPVTMNCNDKKYAYTHSCEPRPGAKYQNNQCVQTSKIRTEYHCLNRMDINEKEIAKMELTKTHSTTSFNYFELFPLKNGE